MQGATPVNDEFEVGYDQVFEDKWHRAELAGCVAMLAVVLCGLARLLGQGPFSHQSRQAPSGALTVDYEPVARHGTPTMVTVHVRNAAAAPRPVTVWIDQKMIEPMGLRRTVPLPDSSTVGQDGVRLNFEVQPNQADALIRLELQPSAVGLVPLHVTDGASSVDWSVFVVP